MYKVGDKVRVMRNLVRNHLYGKVSFHDEELKGEIVTIGRVDKLNNIYKVDEDKSAFWWTAEMFENNSSNKLFKLM